MIRKRNLQKCNEFFMPLSILLNVYIVQRVQRLPSQSSDQEEDDHIVYRNLLFEVIHYAKRIDFCLPVTFSRVARRYICNITAMS